MGEWVSLNAVQVKVHVANLIADSKEVIENAPQKESADSVKNVMAHIMRALKRHKNLIKPYVVPKRRFVYQENAPEVFACIMIWNLVFALQKIHTTKIFIVILVAKRKVTIQLAGLLVMTCGKVNSKIQ